MINVSLIIKKSCQAWFMSLWVSGVAKNVWYNVTGTSGNDKTLLG